MVQSIELSDDLAEAARHGDVVLVTGAGTSAGPPSSLPSWYELNELIARSLVNRLESTFDRTYGPDSAVRSAIGRLHQKPGRFPPEYQAQLIEEMCGSRYFEALSAVDISTTNRAHESIAQLASIGALKAIVTTNFDRLAEHALDAAGVRFRVAFDESTFKAVSPLLAASGDPVPVLKLHGCVSETTSLVDTLKQRRLGRAAALEESLAQIAGSYWVYVGFSGADLESDPDYLGLVPNAHRARGCSYVRWPGEGSAGQPLRPGAELLVGSYAGGGRVVTAEIADLCDSLLDELGASARAERPAATANEPTAEHVQHQLERWARSLSDAGSTLCLAAILEGAGEAEMGARVLDQYVRQVLPQTPPDERDLDQLFAQLHYGRLGAAWGRYAATGDLNGHASNASVEGLQSLLRLEDTELASAADALTALAFIWTGDVDLALRPLQATLHLLDSAERAATDVTDENWLDAWFAAAQTLLVLETEDGLRFVASTYEGATKRALRAGDPIRGARVGALCLLASAEFTAGLDDLDGEYRELFDEAERIGDGVALGFRHLAHGRSLAGSWGRQLVADGADEVQLAHSALDHLSKAIRWFTEQVLDTWMPFLLAQRLKVLADLSIQEDRWASELTTTNDQAGEFARRFPIWESHVVEVRAQLVALGLADGDWRELMDYAISLANDHRMTGRVDQLVRLRDELARQQK